MRPLSFSALPLLLALLPLTGASLRAQEQPVPQTRRYDIITQRPEMFGKVDMFTARRARLGVQISPAAPSDSIGALIQSVTPGGPADKAGIRSGDIILRLNGQSLTEENIRVSRGQSVPGVALTLIAAGINAGDSVVVQYQRGKDRRMTTLIAGDEPIAWGYRTPEPSLDWPSADLRQLEDGGADIRMRVDEGPLATYTMRTPMARVFMLGSPLANLELAPLNPELGRYFSTAEGVLVIDVPADSKLGLKPGDVVLAVDGRKVKLPSQLFRALQSYEPGEDFKLEIVRMKKTLTVTGTVTSVELRESSIPRSKE